MKCVVALVLCLFVVCASAAIGGASNGEKCLTSAGYSWCAFEGKCVRPWELAKEKGMEMTAENIQSYCNVQRIGGSQDSHGCVTTAGYSWCAKEQNCVRPWELASARQVSINTIADFNNYCNNATSAPEVGNDADAHNCLASAGYSWCQKENKCVKSWELMKSLNLEATPVSFQTYCSNCLASAGYSYCYAEQKCVRPWELAKELAIESTPESINSYCSQNPATKSVPAPVGGATSTNHGCLTSAGYSWCAKENKCVKPWEVTSAQQIDNTPEAFNQYCNELQINTPLTPETQPVGGESDNHGCVAGAGYSWCQKENKCVKPWEVTSAQQIDNTPEAFNQYCNEQQLNGPLIPGTQIGAAKVGGDSDSHGCVAGAGYSWCQKENKCVRPWELAQEKGMVGAMTAESFAAYCN